MQHEINTPGPLLDAQGNLREPGWARRMLLDYCRCKIKAGKAAIKEWDYYIVSDGRYGVAFTVADNGYMGLLSASLLDFTKAWEHTKTILQPFPMGKYALPATTQSGNVRVCGKGVMICFEKGAGWRKLSCRMDRFWAAEALEADILLLEPEMDSMVIATPFSKNGRFYYNHKMNCMPAQGLVRLGKLEAHFHQEDAFGTLDWGRGVWTYDNTWYWGNANGILQGKPFGFNIGYGFGNTAAASENVIYYGGRAHKLEEVRFHIPDREKGFLKPWAFSSSDGRFEMDFYPILDRAAKMNALILSTNQHQVFGRFCGKAVLDDGTVLEIKDLVGFAEKVRNRY